MSLTPMIVENIESEQITANGLQFEFTKKNGICIINIAHGAFTNAVANGDTILNLPSGYTPYVNTAGIVKKGDGSCGRMTVSANKITSQSSYDAGESPRGVIPYILA